MACIAPLRTKYSIEIWKSNIFMFITSIENHLTPYYDRKYMKPIPITPSYTIFIANACLYLEAYTNPFEKSTCQDNLFMMDCLLWFFWRQYSSKVVSIELQPQWQSWFSSPSKGVLSIMRKIRFIVCHQSIRTSDEPNISHKNTKLSVERCVRC